MLSKNNCHLKQYSYESENSIDSEIFLDELNRQEVVPFAIHPITLNFLLNEYKKNKQLPKGKHSIYEMGCKKLCEEFSDSRRDAGDIGKYTTSQRVRTAERIAAVMVLSNRNAIWTGHETECPENNLKYSDLVGYTEMVDNLGIEITESIIKETCQTALFSGYGEQRLGWAHRSYAEFLAAEYLHHTLSNDKKILELLCYPDSSEPIVELYEVTVWLAVQRQAIWEHLLENRPKVLLRVARQKSSEDRVILVKKLLKFFERSAKDHSHTPNMDKLLQILDEPRCLNAAFEWIDKQWFGFFVWGYLFDNCDT